jgi:hypothetical protein
MRDPMIAFTVEAGVNYVNYGDFRAMMKRTAYSKFITNEMRRWLRLTLAMPPASTFDFLSKFYETYNSLGGALT